MFGWFKPKSPLTEERRNWIDWRFQWLRQEFGDEPLFRPVVTPSHEFFPDPYAATREDVEVLFQHVCRYMNIGRSRIDLKFFERDSLSRTSPAFTSEAGYAAGMYVKDDAGQITIWLEESRLDVAEAVVGTLAHELAHVHLLADGHIHSDEVDHEHVTDLLTIYFGLGVFTANGTRRDESGYEGGWAWQSVQYTGYLKMHEIAYAMAVYARARGEETPPWLKHLRPDVVADFKVEMSDFRSGKRASPTDPVGSEQMSIERPFFEVELPTMEDDFVESESAERPDDRGEETDEHPAVAIAGSLELESSADEFFTMGTLLANDGEHDRAIDAFSQALELEPSDFEALLNRAYSFLRIGRFTQAIDDASRCLIEDPHNTLALRCRAQSYLELTRYSDALNDVNSAFAISPIDQGFFLLGLAHWGLGNHEQAIKDFTTAIQKSPKFADIYLARSRAYAASGNMELSQADVAESIRRNPDLADIEIRTAWLANGMAASV